MIDSNFILMLLVCVVCSFCGKDFVTLGQHSRRCKQRAHHAEQDHFTETKENQTPTMNSPSVVISSRNVIKCCCVKICKGARGLKMHQRSCRLILGLSTELYADIEEQSNFKAENIPEMDQCSANETSTEVNQNIPDLKRGIKLPKKNLQWPTANDYFKIALESHQPITSQDLNSDIKVLNNIICEYFAQNFEYADSSPDNSLADKYKDYTVKNLKKALKCLKSKNDQPNEIKYVSHILRVKLRSKNINNQSSEACRDNHHSNNQTLNHDK